jgi:hypothetical protein
VSGRIGVELTPTTLRVVQVSAIGHRVTLATEVPWDPHRPADGVAALGARVGRPRGIALAIGTGFLHLTRVDLPPVAPLERVRIIELEPDRYFAAAGRDALAATIVPDAGLAFGVPSALVATWIAAFEMLGPIDWIEPSPIAIARMLGEQRTGTWRVEASPDELLLLKTERGRITSVRRVSQVPVGESPGNVPAFGSTPAAFAAALGALRRPSHHAGGSPALAPEATRRRLASRQRAATVGGALVLAAAVLFAFWSADRWHERTLAALNERIGALTMQAAPADTALRMLRSRESEVAAIRALTASRADPLTALAAIGAALPREATVLSARARGDEWQLDGTTGDASALVPVLASQERFDSVRFLSASSRYRTANRSYETFSLAFRYRPRP